MYREHFPDLSSIYFNAAYMGPLPRKSKEAIIEAAKKEADPSFWSYEWMETSDRVRNLIGDLLGVSGENISHHASVGEVIAHVSNGFHFEDGDVVALVDGEYPSDVLPWMVNREKRGFEIQFLETELLKNPKELVAKLPEKTKILNLSHVAFQTGERVDIKQLGEALKGRDILLVLDISQSFGGMPISKEELAYIDVAPAVGYKWLLGPYGYAFSYFSDRALEKIDRSQGNWLVNPNGTGQLCNYTESSLPGARKFDRGQTPNMIAMAGVAASIRLLNEIGLENIENHNQKMVFLFLENYPKDKYKLLTEKNANILCLKSDSLAGAELKEKLQNSNVDVSVREGNLRISFHLFNSEEEVEKLVASLS